jgi:uracil phosphoribosyltransferase
MHHHLDHPLADAWVSELRSPTTSLEQFRRRARQLSTQLAWAAAGNWEPERVDVTTPLGAAEGAVTPDAPTLIPVLRAGLAMIDGVVAVYGDGPIRPAGVYRDHDTLQPHWYLDIGELDGADVVVCDPMLATGGSILTVGEHAEAAGAAHVTVLALLAAPEGLAAVDAAHPDWDVWVAAIDSHLNDDGYIVPGLGDAGDRWAG